MTTSTYPRWCRDAEPRFVHELARRLTGRFRVVVLCPHAQGAATREDIDGVTVVRYRYAPARLETLVNGGGIAENLKRYRWKWLLVPGFLLMQWLELIRITWQYKPAVVQVHWIIPQGLVAAMARPFMRSTALAVTSHGADLYAFRGALMQRIKQWVLRQAAATTVVSHSMLAPLDALGVPRTRISVLPMGVDLRGQFVPGDQCERNDCELLFVGRLVEKKGLSELISALPLILSERPDVYLTIVGAGPVEHEARARAESLGVAQRIRFVGAVPQTDLPAYYRRAAMLVAPFIRAGSGDQEGLGLVVAEALGCECPVVVGDVPSMQDFKLTPVDARNPRKLSAAILEVIKLSPNGRALIAREQRERCLAGFDWFVAASRYEQLFSELAEEES